MARDEHWMTIQEAAARLGVKEDAVRKRIQRGTLRSEKDLEDGRVYVYLDGAQDATQDTSQDTTQDGAQDAALVEAKDETIRLLTEQLHAERQAHSEARRLLAAALERIPPAIEAPSDERGSPPAAPQERGGSETPPEQERPSWWQRLFGG